MDPVVSSCSACMRSWSASASSSCDHRRSNGSSASRWSLKDSPSSFTLITLPGNIGPCTGCADVLRRPARPVHESDDRLGRADLTCGARTPASPAAWQPAPPHRRPRAGTPAAAARPAHPTGCRSGRRAPAGPGNALAAEESNGTWGRARVLAGPGRLGPDADAEIASVSCASAGNCSAGCDFFAGSGHIQPFIASQRSGTWGPVTRSARLPGPGRGRNAYFASVSCGAAGDCAAGGAYSDGRLAHALVVTEHNGAWSRARPSPALSKAAPLPYQRLRSLIPEIRRRSACIRQPSPAPPLSAPIPPVRPARGPPKYRRDILSLADNEYLSSQ